MGQTSVLILASIAALLLTAGTPAAAQHEHPMGTGFIVSHDVPDDGRAIVGSPSHFGILALGSDEQPDFHQNLHLRVVENGVTLFETTPASGHDYDGVNTFDIAFPVEGNYSVQALDAESKVLAQFKGTAVRAAPGAAFSVDAEVPTSATVGAPAKFSWRGLENGAASNHTDGLFEVRDGTQLVFRAKTHAHDDGMQSLVYGFGRAGTFTVTLTAYQAYPSKGGQDNAPASRSFQVQVKDVAQPAPPAAPNPTTASQPANLVAKGDASPPFELLGTFDPYTTVGPQTLQHLDVLVMDPKTMMPVPHVDFKATLVGPAGTVFESDSLHEYDGILEVAAAETQSGTYTLTVDAARDDWSGHIVMTYNVAAASAQVPTPAAGPQLYDLTGADGIVAGKPANLSFFGHSPGGVPFMHTEFELDITPVASGTAPNGTTPAAVLATKLHTHTDGLFPFTYTFQTPGDYALRLSPFELSPGLAGPYYGPTLGSGLVYTVHVGAGTGVPEVHDQAPAPASENAPGHTTPAVGALLLVVIAAVAATRRR